MSSGTVDKIIRYEDLKTATKDWKDKKIVLVGGCFDLLHFGHVSFLKDAKGQGSFLCVAVESDEFIVKKKKRKPIHSQQERAMILSSLQDVDAVLLLPYFETDTEYFRLVQRLKPSLIAVTEGDSQFENKKKQVESVGGHIYTVKKVNKFSSSKIGRYETFFRN